MLAISFDDLRKEDVDEFEVEIPETGEIMIRFCIDIVHEVIALCEENEDHISAAVQLLLNEEIAEAEITKNCMNHIVGGSIFFNESIPKGQVLLGGSSVEQSLALEKLKHSSATFDVVEVQSKLFEKFYH